MPKTITQLPAAASAETAAVVAADNAAGTATEKVTLGAIRDLPHTHVHNDVGNVLTTLASVSTAQNDYALGNGGIIRISATVDVNITGFVATSSGDARLLSNTGTTIITLKHNNVASSEANRILCVGAGDFEIPPGGSCAVYYDGVDNRWRAG
jgi:hypothetical protein